MGSGYEHDVPYSDGASVEECNRVRVLVDHLAGYTPIDYQADEAGHSFLYGTVVIGLLPLAPPILERSIGLAVVARADIR